MDLCVFMSWEKFEPLINEKSLKSRCFKGIDIGKLKLVQQANCKAWMTKFVMTDWLQQLYQQMKTQKKK